jgi:hypothetical protein
MSLVRGYARGRSWVMAHWRRPHPAEPEQLSMPRTSDEPATPPTSRRRESQQGDDSSGRR